MRGRVTSVWMVTSIAVALAGAVTLVARDTDRSPASVAGGADPARAGEPLGARVPDVTHTYLKDARAALKERGFVPVVVERRTRTYLCAAYMECPAPFPGWRVLGQNPDPGGRVDANSPLVGLTVVRVTRPQTVPGFDHPRYWKACCSP